VIESEVNHPLGWVSVTLGDVTSDLIDRSGPPPGKTFRYIDISGVDRKNMIVLETKTIAAEKAPSRAKQHVQRGDVLVSMTRPNLNAIAIVPEELHGQIASTGFHVLRPKKLDSKFLYYLVQTRSFVESMSRVVQGALYPAVRPKDVLAFQFSLPPLNEQRRIVSKIEELFSQLDEGIASLKAARRQLKVYRQALLKGAFEGKLTEEWRSATSEELESADALLTRIQNERQASYEAEIEKWERAVADWKRGDQKENKPRKPSPPKRQTEVPNRSVEKLQVLPKLWTWTVLDNFTPYGREASYGVLQPGPHTDNGIPLVRVGDITDGRVSTTHMKRVSPSVTEKYRRTELQGGEPLISLVGAIGRTAIAPDSLKGANTARAVGVVPLTGLVNASYMELSFRRIEKIQEMTALAHEVARTPLNLEDVRSATVPLAPRKEQDQIVREVEERLSILDAMEQSTRVGIEQSEAIRQSILTKAFAGQLVPQDPNDEPASVLLARIKAEREAEAEEQGSRRRSRKTKEIVSMADLITVLTARQDWISAQDAFRDCGIADGAETEAIESLYAELRYLVKEARIQVERRGDEDWLRLVDVTGD
jgi:type I restriction enzyme S subunit